VTANLTQTVTTAPADSNFFDDLGADSLVMAKFCAWVRKHEDLPSVSMKDIYRHPTIRSLATTFAAPAAGAGQTAAGVPAPAPAPARTRQ
jgi:Phosphopantetheine attachment site